MKEIFIDIIGYETLYQISNYGRVKALSKTLKNGVGYAVRKEKIIKPAKKDNDYLFVGLTNGKNVKRFYIHRLVAIHFLPNPENKPDVNHIESNKEDNRFFMLEWCTKSENISHSYKHGVHRANFGTKNSKAKLNDEKVLSIKERYGRDGNTIRSLAIEFGVHHSIIDGIIKGKRWPHVTLKNAC
jgi:hypothetical protein